MPINTFSNCVVAGILSLQGLLLILGDVGCYVAWRCTQWLSWHGQLGLVLLGTAVIMLMYLGIKEYVAKSRTNLG